jgi:CRP-like cAMP-binding protein
VLEAEQGSPVRLMAFGTGTILGEVAFCRGERRSASALASSHVKAWQLKRSALAEVERRSPKLAAALHLQIARALAERLKNANRLIRVVLADWDFALYPADRRRGGRFASISKFLLARAFK